MVTAMLVWGPGEVWSPHTYYEQTEHRLVFRGERFLLTCLSLCGQ